MVYSIIKEPDTLFPPTRHNSITASPKPLAENLTASQLLAPELPNLTFAKIVCDILHSHSTAGKCQMNIKVQVSQTNG